MKSKPEISVNGQRIMLLLREGYSNTAISVVLGKSVNTVKYHLKRIYKILGVKNRIEAMIKFNELFKN